MLDIATTFGRIATGLDNPDTANKATPPEPPDVEADLRRAYGGAPQSAPAPKDAATTIPPPIEPENKPASSVSAAIAPVPMVAPPPGAVPQVPAPPRRDAWSRLARQLRRSAASRPML
jgi:hypothetical protein